MACKTFVLPHTHAHAHTQNAFTEWTNQVLLHFSCLLFSPVLCLFWLLCSLFLLFRDSLTLSIHAPLPPKTCANCSWHLCTLSASYCCVKEILSHIRHSDFHPASFLQGHVRLYMASWWQPHPNSMWPSSVWLILWVWTKSKQKLTLSNSFHFNRCTASCLLSILNNCCNSSYMFA